MTLTKVPEVSKEVVTFLMMSVARWRAVENVVLFSKQSIVIKLPVMRPFQVGVTTLLL